DRPGNRSGCGQDRRRRQQGDRRRVARVTPQRISDERGGLGALKPAREIWLQRRVKPGAALARNRLLRRIGRNLGYLLGFLVLAAGVTLLQAALFRRADLLVTE